MDSKTRKVTDEEKHKIYKQIYESALRAAKLLYYKEMFDSKSNDVKTIWRNINATINYKNDSMKKLDV